MGFFRMSISIHMPLVPAPHGRLGVPRYMYMAWRAQPSTCWTNRASLRRNVGHRIDLDTLCDAGLADTSHQFVLHFVDTINQLRGV